MRSIGFDTWVESISNERVFCDELCLTGLSYMYGRHTLVLTNNKMWSTIEMSEPMGLVELLKECSVRLIYLGQLRFGLLHWNPRLPKPLPTSKPPSFNIIEEYTLDDMPATLSASVPNPVHVGTTPDHACTSSMAPLNSPKQDNVVIKTPDELIQKTELEAEHVGTNSPALVEPVTCPEDSLVLSTYPWKRNLELKLHKISDIEADIWCGNIPGFYQYVPDPDPDTLQVTPLLVDGYGSENKESALTLKSIKTEVKTEEKELDQEPAKLIEHANSLIRSMRSLTTDSGNKKHSSSSPQKKKKRTVRVETNVSNALDDLYSSTIDKLSVVSKPTSSDQPKPRTIKCKMCSDSFTSVRNLNLHHKQDHGVVTCEECSKAFRTQSSLDKHMYTHKEQSFVCVACGDRFPFQSHLDQHMIKHVPNKLACPVKSCSKSFKGQGDLNRHIRTHKKGGWHHCAHCDYKNKDKRNVSSHMRVHLPKGEEPYVCTKCEKRFRFGTQYRRHLKSGCQI